MEVWPLSSKQFSDIYTVRKQESNSLNHSLLHNLGKHGSCDFRKSTLFFWTKWRRAAGPTPSRINVLKTLYLYLHANVLKTLYTPVRAVIDSQYKIQNHVTCLQNTLLLRW